VLSCPQSNDVLMTTSSVSFRISRHTQDLAETVHALSQRLVSLEQRLLTMEEQVQALRLQPAQVEEAEAVGLAPIEANIERLLQDCRQLLADADPSGEGGTVAVFPSASSDQNGAQPDGEEAGAAPEGADDVESIDGGEAVIAA
jgi:TolA-binding protein